jgi:two-component system, NarL family, response regulator DevR
VGKIRIGIVDDFEVIRLGLRVSLEAEPDMTVVGDAGTIEDAVRLGAELRPDILLLDLKLRQEGYDGPEVCRRVLAASPKTAVIVLTNYLQDAMVFRSLVAGAKGYVIKDVELVELKKMIRTVYRGVSVLDPKITDQVISRAAGRVSPTTSHSPHSPEKISDVDLVIIGHLSRGLSNKEIAPLVHLSPSTVKDHLERISEMLGVHSRAAIVGEAFRRGFI